MTTRTAAARPTGLAVVTKAQAKAVVKETISGINGLLVQSQKFDIKKSDYNGAAADFKLNSAGKMQYHAVSKLKGLSVVDDSKPLGFTDNGMAQFLVRMSKTYFNDGSNVTMDRADWMTMQQRFPKQFAAIMNQVLTEYHEGDNRNLMVRTYDKNVRAVFTDLYGAVGNTDLLQALHDTLSEAAPELPDMRLVRSNVTPDDLLTQVVWANTDHVDPVTGKKGNYGVGVCIKNGETGGSGIKVLPMLWRSSCTNSILIQDDRALSLKHMGARSKLLARIRVAMLDMLPIAQEGMERVYAAELKQLPRLADVIRGFAQEYKWSDKVTDAVMIGTEGQATVMGIVNGVTFAAHQAEPNNMELMVDMSTLGGKLLYAKDSVFTAAAARGAK